MAGVMGPIYEKANGPGVTRARLVAAQRAAPLRAQTLRTFCACSPFGPWATSNSTLSPSARLRKPSAWIAVKWTNTSGPDSCAIKPKPFASLNHFTLPLAILLRPQHNGARPRTGTTQATAAWDGLKQKSARHLVLAERRHPVTVPRMLEPRAKVLTPPYPVNNDCRFVSQALLRHHRNTSGRADGAITSVSPFNRRRMEAFSMLLPALLSFVVLQQTTSTTAPQPQIAKVEVQPSGGEVPVGGKLKFTARALDAAGQPVPGAQIGWYDNAMQGEVDSTAVFTGGYQGYSRVTAVAYVPGVTGSQVFGTALVHVLPEPPARIDLDR